MIRRRIGVVVLVVAAIVLVLFREIATLFTDILWFRELGYSRVFWVPIVSGSVLALVVGIISFIFLHVNLGLVSRGMGRISLFGGRFGSVLSDEATRAIRRTFLLICVLVAAVWGISMSSHWLVVQSFLHRTQAGLTEPLFGRDIGFYLFALPFYRAVYKMSITLAVIVAAGVIVLYVLTGSISLRGMRIAGGRLARTHAGILLALVLFLKAWGYRLSAFALVYSTRGVTFGAGYTDVHALLPALRILTVVAAAAGFLALASSFMRVERLVAVALVGLAALSVLLGSVYPDVVQRLSVEPSELSRERPYIARNIDYTRKAFGLDSIRVRSLDVRNDLTFDRLVTEHGDTLDNIRLWDWRSLGQTYGQLQEIRAYYDFHDIDLDRYVVDGRTRQMALSARELSLDLLPEGAKTWVSEHLVYTHGYGLAMSPTGEVSSEGLPRFVISDIPPQSYLGFEVARPEIYYGEKTDAYIVVNTTTREFDYPKGEANAYTQYEGTGGTGLSSLWRRAAFAARFGSTKFLISTDLDSRSRVLFARNIRERVARIAPFLLYDEDPYLVLAEGRLYWMWDAYTASDLYPYSQPVEEGFNYIRNSVKLVIDAYNGDVAFYMSDPKEPIVRTLSEIFPGLFAPLDTMPEALKAHVRSPADLFTIQARVLSTYHMTDPDTFYNRGDCWEFPVEVYGGRREQLSPYYVFMRAPGEKDAEYLLILPFVPSGKDNMIGWLMARCDFSRYGELVLYTFPKDRLVFGPMQIEARIDQDPEISQALTLWSQRGSRVVRGNLLVIPVDTSIIYVEPLYLLAERSELPELKRVVVAFGEKVAMDSSLEGALTRVFGVSQEGGARPQTPEERDVEAPGTDFKKHDDTIGDLVKRALHAYEEAERCVGKGDFAGFGEFLAELGRLLEQLEERTK